VQRRGQFFRRRAHQGGIAERKAMIDREHDLPIVRQAEALNISRDSVYLSRGKSVQTTVR
jgi:putative transposase